MKFTPDQTSQIAIIQDNIESRFLAQAYARSMAKRLEDQSQQLGEPIQISGSAIPIYFYSQQLDEPLKLYDVFSQALNRATANTFYNERQIHYKKNNYEFLLLLLNTDLIKIALLEAEYSQKIPLFFHLIEQNCMDIVSLLWGRLDQDQEFITNLASQFKETIKKDSCQKILLNLANSGSSNLLKILLDEGFTIVPASTQGQAPIEVAAQQGYWDIVHTILDAQTNPQAFQRENGVALLYAAHGKQKDLIMTLLNKGASLDYRDPVTKKNLVQIVAEIGLWTIVFVILNQEKSSGHFNNFLYHAMSQAASQNDLDKVNKLIALRADAQPITKNKKSALAAALVIAIRKGYWNIVETILNTERKKNNHFSKEEMTLVLEALATTDKIELAEKFISKEALITLRALHETIETNQLRMFEYLIKLNPSSADIYDPLLEFATNESAWAFIPLILSKNLLNHDSSERKLKAFQGVVQANDITAITAILVLLQSKGQDLSVITKGNNGFLFDHVEQHKNAEIFIALFYNHCGYDKVYCKTYFIKKIMTDFQAALKNNNTSDDEDDEKEKTWRFLERLAEFFQNREDNFKDILGDALILAIRYKRFDKANIFLNSNCEVNNILDGTTALHEAAKHSHERGCEALVARGANLTTRDKENRTPIGILIEKQSWIILKKIIQPDLRTHHKAYIETLLAALIENKIDLILDICLLKDSLFLEKIDLHEHLNLSENPSTSLVFTKIFSSFIYFKHDYKSTNLQRIKAIEKLTQQMQSSVDKMKTSIQYHPEDTEQLSRDIMTELKTIRTYFDHERQAAEEDHQNNAATKFRFFKSPITTSKLAEHLKGIVQTIDTVLPPQQDVRPINHVQAHGTPMSIMI